VGGRPRVSCDTQKLRDHMAYSFRIQLVKVSVSHRRGAGFGHRLRVRKIRARMGGLSCPPDHPKLLPDRDFYASCKTGRLRAQQRLTPRKRTECCAQSRVLQDVSERPRSFCFGNARGSSRGSGGQRCSERQHIGSSRADSVHGCTQSGFSMPYPPVGCTGGVARQWR